MQRQRKELNVNSKAKGKIVEHSKKESKLYLTKVHFVMHGKSDSLESFSFQMSRTHRTLGKGDKVETSAVQKAKLLNIQKVLNVLKRQKAKKAGGQKILCLVTGLQAQ